MEMPGRFIAERAFDHTIEVFATHVPKHTYLESNETICVYIRSRATAVLRIVAEVVPSNSIIALKIAPCTDERNGPRSLATTSKSATAKPTCRMQSDPVSNAARRVSLKVLLPINLLHEIGHDRIARAVGS